VHAYFALLLLPRARRTYLYVLLNAVLHSGIYTWLGVYFAGEYSLHNVGIGLALLGYGVPGFAFGPSIGRLADHWGRGYMIPVGLCVAALSVMGLAARPPLLVAALSVATLSLGYDLVQPALAAIVTDLGPRRGLAMGFNVFTLVTGFGLGSLILGALLRLRLTTAFGLFALGALVAAVAALRLFQGEMSRG
jgi:predicted MFS family arabinose efflux permease